MKVLSTIVLGAVTSSLAAAQFSYSDFSNTTGLVLNERATTVGNVLRVADAMGTARGTVWYGTPVNVVGGFDTTFEFRITQTGQGADGMAFVIQHDTVQTTAAIGCDGGALAYGDGTSGCVPVVNPISNCLAVEIDNYVNGGLLDPNANHISIITTGNMMGSSSENFSLGQATPAVDMNDGQVHTMRVQYDAGMIHVYLNDLVTPILSVAYDLQTGGVYLNNQPAPGLAPNANGEMYVGFTAACGGLIQDHDVLSWDFSGGTLGQSYCGPALPNSTGNPASISAAGSSVAADNDVTLTATGLPPNQFGYFLNSMTQGFVFPVPNSQGALCLSGAIGRYNSQVFNSGSGGMGSTVLSLPNTPTPSGPVSIMMGETWNFTSWYRDANPGPTSNFTDGVTILFQ